MRPSPGFVSSSRTDAIAHQVRQARTAVYWSENTPAPASRPSLIGDHTADLVIIGGGFTGLWAALQAIEEHPGRTIHVIEAETVGHGASSRNGGFCEASLTHGLLNGLSHWPEENAILDRMGQDNLEALLRDLDRHRIDAAVEVTGTMSVATKPWQVDDLAEYAGTVREHGHHINLLNATETRRELNSPTYLAGAVEPGGAAMVDPAKLVVGLAQSVQNLGVVISERSRVTTVEDAGTVLSVRTSGGSVAAPRVLVATNAWAEPEPKIRRYVIPIYDHVLMTQPLSAAQMAAIGWQARRGVSDWANQFHYYRLTEDDRILWGGFDANYYRGNGMGPQYEQRIDSHITIAGHFFDTFPQLEGLGFSHRWAGPIGTTSKFTAAFGHAHRRRLVWVAGYTGLGVGASRWGARVGLDLVDGKSTERTELKMVRRKPLRFPPEPIRNPLIQFTRRQIAQADANHGAPGPWLRLLEAFGVGFDS